MTVLLVTRGHKWNSIEESGKLELERGFPPSKALTELSPHDSNAS